MSSYSTYIYQFIFHLISHCFSIVNYDSISWQIEAFLPRITVDCCHVRLRYFIRDITVWVLFKKILFRITSDLLIIKLTLALVAHIERNLRNRWSYLKCQFSHSCEGDLNKLFDARSMIFEFCEEKMTLVIFWLKLFYRWSQGRGEGVALCPWNLFFSYIIFSWVFGY